MAKVKTEQQKALDQAMDLIINSGADLSSMFRVNCKSQKSGIY